MCEPTPLVIRDGERSAEVVLTDRESGLWSVFCYVDEKIVIRSDNFAAGVDGVSRQTAIQYAKQYVRGEL